jgi:hypothetical protein
VWNFEAMSDRFYVDKIRTLGWILSKKLTTTILSNIFTVVSTERAIRVGLVLMTIYASSTPTHEPNWISLLDYKFTLSIYERGINNIRFAGLEVCATEALWAVSGTASPVLSDAIYNLCNSGVVTRPCARNKEKLILTLFCVCMWLHLRRSQYLDYRPSNGRMADE